MTDKVKLISVESPYNSKCPYYLLRNIQYAILANTHAASLGDATYIPHICNTQTVKYGYNTYIGDTMGEILIRLFGSKTDHKYFLSRDETIKITNNIRSNKIDKIVCYTDFGITKGMQSAILVAKENNIEIEERKLPSDMMKEVIGQSPSSIIVPICTSILPNVFAGIGLYYTIRKGKFKIFQNKLK
jgi:hypothetical protein